MSPIPVRERLTLDEQVRLDEMLPPRRRSLRGAKLLAMLGFWGLHRFYTGSPGLGLVYMLTFGLFTVGWIRDLFHLPELVDDCNRRIEVRLAEFIILERDAAPSSEGGAPAASARSRETHP